MADNVEHEDDVSDEERLLRARANSAATGKSLTRNPIAEMLNQRGTQAIVALFVILIGAGAFVLTQSNKPETTTAATAQPSGPPVLPNQDQNDDWYRTHPNSVAIPTAPPTPAHAKTTGTTATVPGLPPVSPVAPSDLGNLASGPSGTTTVPAISSNPAQPPIEPPPAYPSRTVPSIDGSAPLATPEPAATKDPRAADITVAMNDASGDVPPVAGANNSAPSANAANAKADGTSAGTAVANSDEDYLPNEVKAPRSPYELQAGSHIPIVISESVDSDMPGLVEAVVPTDVKDSISGRYTLIPAGARVLGQYVGVGGPGQTRVAVAFSRLFFPKTGKYLDLGGVPGSDQQGNSGIGGDVDMHSGRLFMTALKLAVLEAGPNLAVGQSGSVFQNPSPAEVAGQTVANSVGQIGQRILTQQVQGPTVHIRIGTRANLTVLKDIVFPGPVEE